MSQIKPENISALSTGFTRPKRVQIYFGFSPATYWRKVKNLTFPKPIKLSAGITANRNSDLAEYEKDPENYRAKP